MGKKRIGILGGGFNPITYGHLIAGAEAINSSQVDQVWFIPCGPRPDKELALAMDRVNMAEIGVEVFFPPGFPVKVKTFELYKEKAIYTYNLLRQLEAEFPDYEFKLIIGSGLLFEIREEWYRGEDLWREAQFLVLHRPSYAWQEELPGNFTWLKDAAVTGISATMVRERIKVGGISTAVGLAPTPVLRYIVRHELY